jgi:hypothetical protein
VLRARHNLSRHPLYGIWKGMLNRCENPGNSRYPGYGGRGITVCPEWHDVAVFIAWIEKNLGHRPEGRLPGGQPVYTLDRIDNDGNYEPGNVQWSDRIQQARNRRFPREAGALAASASTRILIDAPTGPADWIRPFPGGYLTSHNMPGYWEKYDLS